MPVYEVVRMPRLIDADALKEYIDAQKGRPFIGCTIGEALKIMTDEQPTVDAKPVIHGRIEADGYTYTCSVCESRLFEHDLFWRYCPYCGARLEDEEE